MNTYLINQILKLQRDICLQYEQHRSKITMNAES